MPDFHSSACEERRRKVPLQLDVHIFIRLLIRCQSSRDVIPTEPFFGTHACARGPASSLPFRDDVSGSMDDGRTSGDWRPS